MCFDKNIEGYGCGIDMIDGALETLDMTLFKRGMFEFSSDVVVDVGRRGIVERDLRKIFEKFKICKNWKTIAVVNEETECKSNYTAFGKG